MQHAVVPHGDKFRHSTHVILIDCLHQSLSLPAHLAALIAYANRMQILELGQRPAVFRAVGAEDLPAVPDHVLTIQLRFFEFVE